MTDFVADPGRARLTIEIWSDVACPFCYMGTTTLKNAIAKFPHRADISVVHHSFELAPEMPVDFEGTASEFLAEEQGISLAQADVMLDQLTRRAATLGIHLRFRSMVLTNTRAAHRLIHFAKAHGREHEMVERLFRAQYADDLHIGRNEVLADLARQVGLDREAALAALDSNDYEAAVATDIEEARCLGISGVPFFVFNDRFVISGAQPESAFAKALDTAWKGGCSV